MTCDANLISDNSNLEITINNYGSGSPCGGSVLNHNGDVFRSFDGGLARMNAELNLEENLIGFECPS